MTYGIDSGIALIALDDGKANAMGPDFFRELNGALDRAESDHAGAVIFTGRPGFFSGGLDMKLMPTLSPSELRDMTRAFAHTMLRVFQFPVPTLAACTGHAIAGGAILAFACDRRLALDGPYRMQMNEVAIGIPLPSWMLLIAGSAIPPRWRTELLLHARACTPREARERSIIDEVVDAGGDVVARTREAAAPLLALNRAAYATSKLRMRADGAQQALRLLEGELPG
jgi:enoyl-CoA hydratase